MNILIIGTGKLGYEVYRRVAVMPAAPRDFVGSSPT